MLFVVNSKTFLLKMDDVVAKTFVGFCYCSFCRLNEWIILVNTNSTTSISSGLRPHDCPSESVRTSSSQKGRNSTHILLRERVFQLYFFVDLSRTISSTDNLT